ncbi:NSs protein [Apeu virus]|uniref:Non-structural protein NS-S n=2 Tax=Apeu virus TaxID=334520 RepID=A0A2Z3DH48_9VIRU|nr:NSs protein [Apeu virus]AVX48949.1 NSs protein [Apeu virus]
MSLTVLLEIDTESWQLLCLSFRLRRGVRIRLLLTLNKHTKVLSMNTGRSSLLRILECSSSVRMRLNRSSVRVRQSSLTLNLALGRSLLLITITLPTQQIRSLMVS